MRDFDPEFARRFHKIRNDVAVGALALQAAIRAQSGPSPAPPIEEVFRVGRELASAGQMLVSVTDTDKCVLPHITPYEQDLIAQFLDGHDEFRIVSKRLVRHWRRLGIALPMAQDEKKERR